MIGLRLRSKYIYVMNIIQLLLGRGSTGLGLIYFRLSRPEYEKKAPKCPENLQTPKSPHPKTRHEHLDSGIPLHTEGTLFPVSPRTDQLLNARGVPRHGRSTGFERPTKHTLNPSTMQVKRHSEMSCKPARIPRPQNLLKILKKNIQQPQTPHKKPYNPIPFLHRLAWRSPGQVPLSTSHSWRDAQG